MFIYFFFIVTKQQHSAKKKSCYSIHFTKSPNLNLNLNIADPAGFDLWFTWCQTCRHGGHATHIFDWFRNHNTCPVSNCSCHCYSLSKVADE